MRRARGWALGSGVRVGARGGVEKVHVLRNGALLASAIFSTQLTCPLVPAVEMVLCVQGGLWSSSVVWLCAWVASVGAPSVLERKRLSHSLQNSLALGSSFA